MKMKILLGLVITLVIATGCVKTQNDKKQVGVPFVKDKFESRYERPVAQVYAASASVIRANGILQNESTLHGTNGATTLVIEGRVQERKVYIGVKAIDPRTTAVTVQVRTSMGGRDLDLAREIDKQIAITLTAMR
jgi:hypothetical protein